MKWFRDLFAPQVTRVTVNRRTLTPEEAVIFDGAFKAMDAAFDEMGRAFDRLSR